MPGHETYCFGWAVLEQEGRRLLCRAISASAAAVPSVAALRTDTQQGVSCLLRYDLLTRGVCALHPTHIAPGQSVAVAAGTITQRRSALLRSCHQLLDAHHHTSHYISVLAPSHAPARPMLASLSRVALLRSEHAPQQ